MTHRQISDAQPHLRIFLHKHPPEHVSHDDGIGWFSNTLTFFQSQILPSSWEVAETLTTSFVASHANRLIAQKIRSIADDNATKLDSQGHQLRRTFMFFSLRVEYSWRHLLAMSTLCVYRRPCTQKDRIPVRIAVTYLVCHARSLLREFTMIVTRAMMTFVLRHASSALIWFTRRQRCSRGFSTQQKTLRAILSVQFRADFTRELRSQRASRRLGRSESRRYAPLREKHS